GMAEAEQEPDEGSRLWALAILRHAAGDRAGSDEALEQLLDRHAANSAYQVAEVHAMRREADAAFEWLDRAYTQRDGGLSGILTSDRLRSLHGDPRWAAFKNKMGFDG